MTNLDSIFKSRDITLPTKVCLVKAMVFPVVMYGCESWTVKKAERWKSDAFEQWCWRRLLSPLDCKEIQPVHSKGNQPWVFFGRNDAKAETPVLWPPHEKSWLTDAQRDWGQEEKTLMLGKIEGRGRKGQMTRRLAGITDAMDMRLSKLQKLMMDWEDWHAVVQGVTKSRTRLNTNQHKFSSLVDTY